MRPSVGFAAIDLLEKAGCKVVVPEKQTCCGQPVFNSGDDRGAVKIAQQLIEKFTKVDYLVIPSGSCAAMIKHDFPQLFANNFEWLERAQELADKTYELLSFLHDVCDYQPDDVNLDIDYTYHHSCSGLRKMKVFEQPLTLLSKACNAQHKPLKDATECCGFGGAFCVKYSDISNQIVTEKTEKIHATDAQLLLGGDWGCLMNIAGKLNRQSDTSVTVMHTAEVLAGMADRFLVRSKNDK